MMKKRILLISVLLSASASNVLLACGSSSTWVHYLENLPGTFSGVNYGNREYWSNGSTVAFTEPTGITFVEKEVTIDLLKSFSENDARKILYGDEQATAYYSIDTKTFSFNDAKGYAGYTFDDPSDVGVIGETEKRVLVMDNNNPAVYIDVLTVNNFISDEDSFNSVLWSYDHDVTGYYILTNDISFVSSKRSNDTVSQTEYHFLGTLNGLNKTIKEIYVNNEYLGIFGGTLQSKIIGETTYSPKITNLTIEAVSGKNLLLGESIQDVSFENFNVYQGSVEQETYYQGLLAKEIHDNVSFQKCIFDLGDFVDEPCLFLNKKTESAKFTSSTVKYARPSSYLYLDDETSIAGSNISGITWKATGDFSITAYSGKSINVIGEEPYKYLSIVDDPETTNDEIAEYLAGTKTHSSNAAEPVKIKWQASSATKTPITLSIYTDKEMTSLYKQVTGLAKSSTYSLYNLIPGQTYYYRLNDSSSPIKYSFVDSFSLASHVRIMNVNNSISNMRDIGGWVGADGHKVKYGLLYRSANWEGLGNKAASILVNDLGVKTELDVRLPAEYSESAYPIEGINFIQNGLTDYYGAMLTDSNTITNITKLFNNILTNQDNYPIVYHCSIGCDRTGFASFLIESALGLADVDIYRDYELSSYYLGDRARADIYQRSNGDYYFREDGGRSDFYNETGFKMLIEKNLKSYYTESGTISDAVINFLKTKCSVTDAAIQKVRDILLEA